MSAFKRIAIGGIWRVEGALLLVAWLYAFLCSFTAGTPIDNALIGDAKTECRNGKAFDLAFILDGSGSIGKDTFDLQKEFVSMIIDRLDIGLNSTRVATVQFSDEPQLEFNFIDHKNSSSLKGAVSKIKYITGSTMTGEALLFASENVFDDDRTTSANKADIVKTAIVITDGRAQDDVEPAAEKLRSQGVVLYAVGVTEHVDPAQLLQIAGGDQHRVFTVESFEKLDRPFSAVLTKELCKTTYKEGLLDISCDSDGIGIQAKTKHPFEGNVYVRGFFHTKSCRTTAESFLANPTLIGITVPFNNCGVRRYRSLNPRGVFVETVVVFSFHPRFLTKVDQAIKVQCFYMEAQKTVNSDLEVSMFTPDIISKSVPMPTCSYTLRKDGPDGPLVSYAIIGDTIFHRWECTQQNENEDIFGMLVHSCYVDDGQGNQVNLLDSKGCGLDTHLLPTPLYNESSSFRLAYQETHVFKFADKPVLQFQCQVTVCAKIDGGCEGITPPDCSNQRNRRSNPEFVTSEESGLDQLDVVAEPVTVFEDGSEKEQMPINQINILPRIPSRTCFEYRTFSFVIVSTAVSYCILIAIVSACWRMAKRPALDIAQ